MYRPRRSSDLRRSLTFGGRMPAAVGLLLLLMVVATVASWILRNSEWAELSPAAILQGQIWRIVSWAFVQGQPLTLLFGGLMLYSFGSQLAYDWGEARLLSTFLGLTAGAALITVAIAIVWPPFMAFGHLDMWPPVIGLLLMWSLRYPDQQLSFWGILPMTGRTMAILVVAGTVLYGLAAGGVAGLARFTPHFASIVIGWALSRGRLRLPLRRWKLAWRDYLLERQLRRRSRHLKVVRKNGRDEPPRWMN
ncbi:MAG TPA: rhomboid family intramembrane serine protease [Anaeromyxobacter sp.]|nr:rhomboid family intramembrane serine protease [Anaeromyxobacter sp.]